MSENERHAMLDECFDYDNKLRANGHLPGQALQSPDAAMTLYWKNGKVAVTDAPYAETKEHLGRILVLEARDLNHAVQIISQHPGVKYGPLGDTSCCGSERHDSGERTPPRKRHRKMSILGMQLQRDDKRSSGGMPLRVPRDRRGIRHLAYNVCGV